MKTLDRRLLRNLNASKAQMLAVVAIIVMGLFAFTMFTTLTNNMGASLEEYYRTQVFADIHVDFSWTGIEAVEELRRVPGVAQAEGRAVVETRSPLRSGHEPNLRLVGNSEDPGINIPYVIAGRLPTRSREVALLDSFARANDLQIGDRIPLVFSGEAIAFTVVGFAKSPEYTYVMQDLRAMLPDDLNFGIGFLRLRDIQELVGGHGRINSATVLIDPRADPDTVRDAIEERLAGRGLRSAITRNEHLSHVFVEMELDGLEQFSRMIPVAFLSIASVVIYMMISRMIQDDRATIGILKATGYTNGEILSHYLKHALVLGATGAIFGLLSGQLLSGPFSQLFVEFFHIPQIHSGVYPLLHLSGLALTTLFCAITGLIAARGVLRIVPAEALRPPAPPPGSRNLVEILAPRCWAGISFTWRTVLRYIFRDKKRFLLAVAGVALSFSIILLPLYSYTMITTLFVDQYDRLDLYDYAILLDRPLEQREAMALLREVRVGRAEPLIEYPVTIRYGWREESILARALPPDAQLQRFEDVSGRTLHIGRRGVLISEFIAGQLGVGPGDVVELTSPILPGRSAEVEVRAVVTQYLGSGLYMSVEDMRRLAGTGIGYNGILVTSRDDVTGILAGTQGVASIQSTEDLVAGFMRYMDLFVMALGMYTMVGGLLGFAILFNTVSTSVTERRREIASLRVLGYSKAEVFGLLLRENLVAIVLGLLLGMPLGYSLIALLSHYFSSELFMLPLRISPFAYLAAGVLTTAFAAGTLAAIRVRVWRMGLLEALTSRLS